MPTPSSGLTFLKNFSDKSTLEVDAESKEERNVELQNDLNNDAEESNDSNVEANEDMAADGDNSEDKGANNLTINRMSISIIRKKTNTLTQGRRGWAGGRKR